jgi:hypothetical protein
LGGDAFPSREAGALGFSLKSMAGGGLGRGLRLRRMEGKSGGWVEWLQIDEGWVGLAGLWMEWRVT